MIRSDNATQFVNTQVKYFMSWLGIHHVYSTPLCPQSNGQAENAVKQVKRILHQAILTLGPSGKANWDIVLPQCLATLNNYCPLGYLLSRQNLCFNPHFLGYICTIQYNQELFSPALYTLQQLEDYKRLDAQCKKLLSLS